MDDDSKYLEDRIACEEAAAANATDEAIAAIHRDMARIYRERLVALTPRRRLHVFAA